MHGVSLIIIGLFACVVWPPLGIALIVAAVFVNQRHRRRFNAEVERRRAKARKRREREQILAVKSMP